MVGVDLALDARLASQLADRLQAAPLVLLARGQQHVGDGVVEVRRLHRVPGAHEDDVYNGQDQWSETTNEDDVYNGQDQW